jgi:hypothetical protein
MYAFNMVRRFDTLKTIFKYSFMRSLGNCVQKEQVNDKRKINSLDIRHNNHYSNSSRGDTTEWRTLYRFPYVKYIGLVSRFKIYQIMTMLALCYPLHLQYTENFISKNLYYTALGGCVGTTITFIVISYFATKVIGELALDSSHTTLKISRLTFNGRRCEEIFDLDSLVPFMDSNTSSVDSGLFKRLYIEGEEELVYFYSLKYSRILDRDFYKCLGIPL